jgi:hypothetical protein
MKLIPALRSFRFFLVTLAVIGTTSLIGIIIPQELETMLYIRKYGVSVGRFIVACGWDRIFYSWWFFIPFGAFVCNLALCISTRLRTILRFLSVPRPPAEHVFASNHTAIRSSLTCSFDQASRRFMEVRSAGRFACRKEAEPGMERLTLQKGRMSLPGSMVLHAGLLVLLAGALYQFYLSKAQLVMLPRGVAVPADTFSIRLVNHEFFIRTTDDGGIVNYETDLEVFDANNTSLTRGITRVNKPLYCNGLYFYQNQYSADSEIFEHMHAIIIRTGTADTLCNGTMPFNSRRALGDSGYAVECDAFLCDFAFDIETKTAFNRSMTHNQPAFRFKIFLNDSLIGSQWVFQKIAMPHHGGDLFSIHVISYEKTFSSGIEIRKKPGTLVILTGIFFVSIGLILVFMFPFRQVACLLKQEGNTVALTIIPFGQRFTEWFDDTSARIINKWKEGI